MLPAADNFVSMFMHLQLLLQEGRAQEDFADSVLLGFLRSVQGGGLHLLEARRRAGTIRRFVVRATDR